MEDGFFKADGGIGGAPVHTPLEIFLGGLDDCCRGTNEYGEIAVTGEATAEEEEEGEGSGSRTVIVAMGEPVPTPIELQF